MLITPTDNFAIFGASGMAGRLAVPLSAQATTSSTNQAAKSSIFWIHWRCSVGFEHHLQWWCLLPKVGGIHANDTPGRLSAGEPQDPDTCDGNGLASGVRRLLFLGSSCIYPKYAEQPIKEEALLTGPLEPTNECYAIAKIAGIKLCQSLRHQHGFDAISLMPTNLYGPGDNYDQLNSHVLPALIRRFHEAVEAKAESVTCWGSGTPLREFLHVDDLGEACVFALEHWSPEPGGLTHLNVGTGLDLSIRELAEAVACATGFTGRIQWDKSKSDGTPKKQLDVSRLEVLGWRARIPLALGLESTIELFREQLSQKLVRL